jgi:predicted DsbA family dithiol-disulfide isomerase
LEDLFAGRNTDRAARQARMQGLMAAEGLPYGERTHSYNSRLAQELGKWADTQEHGDASHDAMFRAYFVEGRNIGDVETLLQIAEAVGLSVPAARAVLSERRFKDLVDADWQRSRAYGITGVPTFVANGKGVVGAQPYEVLERLILMAGAIPRSEQG